MTNISKVQVEKLQQLSPEKRYKHSIKRICDFEEMYSILDENDSWELAQVEDKVAFFIWPAKEYAEPFLQGKWATCKVEKITIEEFHSEILEFLQKHQYLLNVFAVSNLSGFVVTVDEFISDLESEMENYD